MDLESARREGWVIGYSMFHECSFLQVLQPGKKLYDSHGVARPSAFIAGSNPRFIPDLEALMADHGGPGSWLWKKLPKKPTQVSLNTMVMWTN